MSVHRRERSTRSPARAAQWFEELDDRGVFTTDDRPDRPPLESLAGGPDRPAAPRTSSGGRCSRCFPISSTRGLDALLPRRAGRRGRASCRSGSTSILLPIARNFHGAGITEMAQIGAHRAAVATATRHRHDHADRGRDRARDLRSASCATRSPRPSRRASVAEEASRLKDEFLATLSHEIRTPLNAVLGWTRILRTQPSRRDRARTRSRSSSATPLSQMRLVEDLLDMARIISGKLRLEMRAGRAGRRSPQAAIDVVAPPRPARSRSRSQAELPDDPAVGQRRCRTAAAGRLEPALERGEVHRAGRHACGRRSPSGTTTSGCRSSDTGQGIAPDFLPYVFDRFRQADASASRRHGGLGLGLALVRQIVELHGGTVGVESGGAEAGDRRSGSRLPVVPESADTRAAIRPQASEPVTLERRLDPDRRRRDGRAGAAGRDARKLQQYVPCRCRPAFQLRIALSCEVR